MTDASLPSFHSGIRFWLLVVLRRSRTGFTHRMIAGNCLCLGGYFVTPSDPRQWSLLDQYASSCSGHLDQFVSDDRLSDEIHTNGYTQIHPDEQTHTHKHTPYKHLHAHKRHTAYIHPHTHTHTRTSTYNQTHTSPTHTDPYAFYLSRLSLPHAHSSALYVCSFNLSKLFPCGVFRSCSYFLFR